MTRLRGDQPAPDLTAEALEQIGSPSMELVMPIIHLNGTSAEGLHEQYEKSLNSLQEAIGDLREASPHPRDYYPEPGLFEKARDQHLARITAVQSVYDSMMEQTIALMDLAN